MSDPDLPNTSIHFNPCEAISQQLLSQPDALALHCDGADYTYDALLQGSLNIARQLKALSVPHPRVGILASTSVASFQGIIGCGWVAGCYLPLDPAMPAQRLLDCLDQADLDLLLLDAEGKKRWEADLLPHRLEHSELRVLMLEELIDTDAEAADQSHYFPPLPMSQNTPVYLMFTSGSTGTPKGVQIQAGNLHQALSSMQERFAINPQDRLSQSFPLTFDLSLFDIFMAWQQGASLHVVPARQRLAPAGFIRQQQLSCWFSVPSVAAMMARMGQLKPGSFPSLRWSLFCGESLPVALAEQWQHAAAGSQLENLYGPTEATIACFSHRFLAGSPSNDEFDIVAIGTPFKGLMAAVIDSQGHFQLPGVSGQLVIAGGQLSDGYWRSKAQTEQSFQEYDHPTFGLQEWYLTGDRVIEDDKGLWHFLGRIDRQIKIRGVRAELDEVQAQVRACLPDFPVAIIPLPLNSGLCLGLAAVIETGAKISALEQLPPLQSLGIDRRELMIQLKKRLVTELLPVRWYLLESFPLTAHGKIDYQALENRFDEGVFG